ncbi:MAG: Methyltransferase type 11 [Acidimicrobiales bacterium]|nr:Methyltransferase type 11 [Acidimicrobiales bacterium]
MRTDEAIAVLKADPAYRDVIEDLYLDDDPQASVARFGSSAELAAVRSLLGDALVGATVLDLGAGAGVAAAGLLAAGAARVVAVEPDPSDTVGLGALAKTGHGRPIVALAAFGEALPVATASIDVVYCRQVLHHTTDLAATLRECARVLRPGGSFVACREHVADDEAQLAHFLASHPVHRLAGGEHAYRLDEYRGAIERAGLHVRHELGPWDSIINAFPTVASDAELPRTPSIVLGRRFGTAGRVLGTVPGIKQLAWRRLRRPAPGRLYSFVATKPSPT